MSPFFNITPTLAMDSNASTSFWIMRHEKNSEYSQIPPSGVRYVLFTLEIVTMSKNVWYRVILTHSGYLLDAPFSYHSVIPAFGFVLFELLCCFYFILKACRRKVPLFYFVIAFDKADLYLVLSYYLYFYSITTPDRVSCILLINMDSNFHSNPPTT